MGGELHQLELAVSADCPDRPLLVKLVEVAESGCLTVNTLRGKIDLKIRVAEHAGPRP